MSDLQTEQSVVYDDKYLSFKRNTETVEVMGDQSRSSRS
jgi:hypothetical protein